MVDVLALAADLFGEVGVLVPAAVEELDESDAALGHSSGEEAVSAEVVLAVAVFVEAVHGFDVGGLGAEIGEFGDVDPDLTSLAVLSLVNWTYQWFRRSVPLTTDEVADHFWLMLMNGICD